MSPVVRSCCYQKCTANHFEDPVLAWIYLLTPVQLTELYANALEEMLLSLRADSDHDRYASYITRLRGSMECYMRGLWAGLVADPLEVVHDASGEQPVMLLEKLSNIVFSQVLGKQPIPSFSFKTVGAFESVGDLLNTTAHMTAYLLALSAVATPEHMKKMLSGIDAHIEHQLRTLRKVAQLLKEGETRREIISVIRAIFKDTELL
jgi:hypothetical protein